MEKEGTNNLKVFLLLDDWPVWCPWILYIYVFSV